MFELGVPISACCDAQTIEYLCQNGILWSMLSKMGDGKVWGGARSDLAGIQDVTISPLLAP